MHNFRWKNSLQQYRFPLKIEWCQGKQYISQPWVSISLLLTPVKWYAAILHMQNTDINLIQLFKAVLLLAMQCVTHALPRSVMLSSWTRQIYIPITRTASATLKIHLPYYLISDTEQQEMWTAENRVMTWQFPWSIFSVFSSQQIKHFLNKWW